MNLTRLVLLAFTALSLAIGQSGTAKKAASPAASTGAQESLLDINSASTDELDTLPGIGPALAQKIVAGRPYRAKTDLVNKKVIPQATYDKIKDRIIARQKK
jgi:competence protein ComEA